MSSLGDRMKSYECHRVFEEKGMYVVRVDGKAFSSYTKQFGDPYSEVVAIAMQAVAEALLHEVQGSLLVYAQSDEASVLFSNMAISETQLWMGGSVDKIVSVAASVATRAFNAVLSENRSHALFDARAFQLPVDDVPNYFLWRAKDGSNNAIQKYARTKFSHKELHGKRTSVMLAMLYQGGYNYLSDVPNKYKYGQVVTKTRTTCTTDDGDIVQRRTIQIDSSQKLTYHDWNTALQEVRLLSGINVDEE